MSDNTIKKTEMGELLDSRALFMRVAVGDAGTDADPKRYELSTNLSGAPVIRDTKTGRWFAFSWAGLLDHARAAGISDDEPAQQAENPAV
ncbi:MAG: hypothetical protein QJR04_25075 [Burkholderia multivorans]|nr:hypothetical protein [Burkholderia multivorans]